MTTRIFKPSKDDICTIINLLSPYVKKGTILERTEIEISKNLDSFLIAQENNETIGVISFYDYGPELKEIRSLAVREDQAGNNIGSTLVQSIVKKITPGKKIKVFVLTYSPVFFEKNGFSRVPKGSLPEKIWKDCSKCKYKDNCQETALVYLH